MFQILITISVLIRSNLEIFNIQTLHEKDERAESNTGFLAYSIGFFFFFLIYTTV